MRQTSARPNGPAESWAAGASLRRPFQGILDGLHVDSDTLPSVPAKSRCMSARTGYTDRTMRTLRQRTEFGQVGKGCVLTIGNFDGVHLGHQEIFRTARRIAHERGTEMVVMTFEPHPVAILHPEKAPGVLTPLSLKLHLLEEYADNCIIVLEDNKHLLRLSPEAFVDEFLMATIRPSVIVEGDDFHFGAARAGDIRTLTRFGQEKGFEVMVVPPRQIELADRADPAGFEHDHSLHARGRTRRRSGRGTVPAVPAHRPDRVRLGTRQEAGFPDAQHEQAQPDHPGRGRLRGFRRDRRLGAGPSARSTSAFPRCSASARPGPSATSIRS